jgi:hypothetical protein
MKSQLHTSTENKPTRRRGPQSLAVNAWWPAQRQQTAEQSPRLIVERVIFTAEEHREVQQQIERRARELWCAAGRRRGNASNDWLQAEREVLEQFIWAYARRNALEQSSSQGRRSTHPNTINKLKL